MVHVSLSLLTPNPVTFETVDQSQLSDREAVVSKTPNFYISFAKLDTCAKKRDSIGLFSEERLQHKLSLY